MEEIKEGMEKFKKEENENVRNNKGKARKRSTRNIIISQIIILLIFIIEVGILLNDIYDETNSTTSTIPSWVSTFNSMLEPYEGESLTASSVNTLCSLIIYSNSEEQKREIAGYPEYARYVGIYFDPSLEVEVDEDTNINVKYGVALAEEPSISLDRTYTITAIYGDEGYIIGMEIK